MIVSRLIWQKIIDVHSTPQSFFQLGDVIKHNDFPVMCITITAYVYSVSEVKVPQYVIVIHYCM